MPTSLPRGPCPEPARVIDAEKRQSSELAPATRRSHSLAGEDRSDRMGDATWGGKAIPLGKRACGRGEAGKRCELGEATFRPRAKWAWRRAKTQEKEGIWLTAKYCLYLVVFRTSQQTVLTLAQLCSEGPPCPNPTGPTSPPRPRPRSSSGHVDVASPLTFRPKTSPAQSYNIIIILIK